MATFDIFMDDFAHMPLYIHTNELTGWLSTSTFRTHDCKYRDSKTAVMTANGIRAMGDVIIEWLRGMGVNKPHLAKGWQAAKWTLYPPLLALPGASKAEYVYMDLKAAYPSIYERLTWGDEYIPGAWARRDNTLPLMNDFPYKGHKLARNAVMGIARGGRAMEYKQGVFVRSIPRKGFVNHHLIGAIMDILHDIAHMMLRYGLVYWNTDGGILPAAAAAAAAAAVADKWGMELRAKHRGECRIWGVGAYRVGDYKTALDLPRPKRTEKIHPPTLADVDRLLWLLR